MVCGCIDIGTNTTRLLIADVGEESVRELACERAYTPPGSAELAEIAGTLAAHARDGGCERTALVATAAARASGDLSDLLAALEAATGLEPMVLTGEQEAHLTFDGATRELARDGRPVAVIDVGGGSTEIAVGAPGETPGWCLSLPIGSGTMSDQCLRSDPPTPAEIDELRGWVTDALEGVQPPAAERAFAVGGTAISLAEVVGGTLGEQAFGRSLDVLGGMSCAEAGEHFGIDPVRVRLLPAGITILRGVSERLGLEPRIAGGGLREGVVRALARGEL